MQRLLRRIVTAGGETATWAREGALVGSLLGLVCGFIFMGAAPQPIFENVSAFGSFIYTFSAPIIGLLFGAFAGAFVGIGTPKFKPHPQQGRINDVLYRRRKNWR